MSVIEFAAGQLWVPTKHYGSLATRQIRQAGSETVQYVEGDDRLVASRIPREDFEAWVRVFHCRVEEPAAPPPSRLDRFLGPLAGLASRAATGMRRGFKPATPSLADELRAFREAEEAPGSTSVYHGTITADPITRFRPLSHFGTRRAAGDVIDRKLEELAVRQAIRRTLDGIVEPWPDAAYVYEVALDIRNPWQVEDRGAPDPIMVSHILRPIFPKGAIADRLKVAEDRWWDARAAARELDIRDDEPCAERDLVKDELIAVIRDALAMLGHDGLVYRNLVEDRHSHSLTNLYEDQVRILRCWRLPVAPLMV